MGLIPAAMRPSRKLVSPHQIVADATAPRGRRLFPGFYWVGFGDAGYQRRIVRTLLVVAVLALLRLAAGHA